jgi:hypothetical protein
MLIARQKEIVVAGQAVTLFSLDGRTWFSRPSDMTEFKQRRAHLKASVQNSLATFDGRRLPYVTPYSWMGFDR